MKGELFSSIEEILQVFTKYLQTEGQRLNTIKGNTGVIKNYLKWTGSEGLNYEAVTYNDLLSYINYQKKQGNQLRTINHKLQAIRHFYNCLQQQQLIKDNPAEELRLRGIITKQPHDLPEWEDLEELYQQYPNKNLVDKRNKVMLGMLIYQGLTSGEITALETKDVKLEEGKLYVPPTGKSNERILKLAAHQILQTQQYLLQERPIILQLTGKTTEKLFISLGTGETLTNSFAKLMKKLRRINPKIKDLKQTCLTARQVRAGIITYWLKQHPIRQVQYMAGHKYVSSTERYRTDLLETLQEQLEEMHPLK